jgi:hypothetical protein
MKAGVLLVASFALSGAVGCEGFGARKAPESPVSARSGDPTKPTRDGATPTAADAAAPDPRLELSKWEAETITPMSNAESRPCNLGSLSPLGPKAMGRCVRARPGPLVLTEIHAPGGCNGELFALAGSLTSPRWIVYAPPNGALNLAGGYLVVREKEYLIVGTVASPENKIRSDVRCSVTWVGFHPLEDANPEDLKNPYPGR